MSLWARGLRSPATAPENIIMKPRCSSSSLLSFNSWERRTGVFRGEDFLQQRRAVERFSATLSSTPLGEKGYGSLPPSLNPSLGIQGGRVPA
jgi:hypothetical protein